MQKYSMHADPYFGVELFSCRVQKVPKYFGDFGWSKRSARSDDSPRL